MKLSPRFLFKEVLSSYNTKQSTGHLISNLKTYIYLKYEFLQSNEVILFISDEIQDGRRHITYFPEKFYLINQNESFCSNKKNFKI